MIDLKLLRENPDLVRDSQRTRGEDPSLVDQLLTADEKRRSSIAAADTARAEQKAHGKKVGQASPEERPALLEAAGALKKAVKNAEESEKAGAAEVDRLQRMLSNIVEEGTPAGGEDDFVEIERIGEIPTF
ncbi:MAG: serine--tRNA ligase, partial [Actinomycetales bacterium]|nr:serine--tRNA ligase [Actinomycetales bacterium]